MSVYDPDNSTPFIAILLRLTCLIYQEGINESEAEFKRQYPQIYKHLSNFKQLMIQIRDRNQEKTSEWFTLDRAREEAIFNVEKIVAPQRSKSNNFGYTTLPWYTSADVYFIVRQNENSLVNLKFILGLLNSNLYFHWLYNRGKRKGEMLELYQKPLSEIPIPELDTQVKKELASQIESLIDEILTEKETNPEADTHLLEARIDKLVYQLYDLTEEEIKIIENEVNKSASDDKELSLVN